MNEILREHLEKVNGTAGTSTGLEFLQLKHESGNYYAANTYLVALKQLAALRTALETAERELQTRRENFETMTKRLIATERERDIYKGFYLAVKEYTDDEDLPTHYTYDKIVIKGAETAAALAKGDGKAGE